MIEFISWVSPANPLLQSPDPGTAYTAEVSLVYIAHLFPSHYLSISSFHVITKTLFLILICGFRDQFREQDVNFKICLHE